MQLIDQVLKKAKERFSAKPETAPLKKSRKKGPVIAVIAGALVLAAILYISLSGGIGGTGGGVLVLSDTTLLIRSDLQNTISATGTVESAHSMMVYSTAAYTVEEVFVDVGDYVEEGQLLAKLDEKNIQNQIESQEASLKTANNSSAASIAAARDNYQQFKNTLDQGLNSSILNAENSVTSAYNNYNSAVTTYERFKEALEEGTNSSIVNAENSVTSAYNGYISASNAYERYRAGLNAGENTTLINQRASVRNAESSLAAAKDTYYSALNEQQSASSAVQQANNTLSSAKSSLTSAQTELNNLQSQLDRLQNGPDENNPTGEDGTAGEGDTTTDDVQSQALEQEQEIAVLEQKIEALQAQIDQLKASVDSAQDALTKAESVYNSCQQQVTSAQRNWNNAEAAYRDAQATYSATVTSVNNQLADYSTSMQTAYESYLTAIESLNTARNNAQNTLADYETSVETAYESYQSAQTNLEAAEASAQNQLQSYKDSLNSAYANADKSPSEVSLRQLRAELEGTEITAPASGTITAVYAKVGSSGSGLLFVIEDVDDLVVSTSVKDYDVGSVRTGMAVTIKSDSTGNNVFDGKVTSIAPTANKTSLGTTDTSGDISFATDVAVVSRDTGLRIGMSVRLNFVLEEAKNVLSVPYEAVYQNEEGQTCILAALEQEDGTYLLQEFPVTTGMENDLDIVVEGAGLEAGMRIVSETDAYRSLKGQTVTVGERKQKSSGMMGGF